MEWMAIDDVRAVNDLFVDLYPHIANEVLEYFPCRSGRGLELGPFAPGIAIEVARVCPELEFVVGTNRADINEYITEAVSRAGLARRFEVRPVDPHALAFEAESFDLVIFRGALFFWQDEPMMLREIDRVLRPGGVGFVGGGFGALAPSALVDAIVHESRDLNRRLGKRNISISQARAFADKAGLSERATIDRRRGLWLVFKK